MRCARSSSGSEPTSRTVHEDGLGDDMRERTEGRVVVASDVALRAAYLATYSKPSHGSRYVRMPTKPLSLSPTRSKTDELTFGMMTSSFPSTMP